MKKGRRFVFYEVTAEEKEGVKSSEIELLFPRWERGNERVAVFSPHDDDALLGAGYLILAALAEEAEVYVFIFCDGSAGYSDPEERETIVETRKEESGRAYALLGLEEENLIRFDYPDFSVASYLGLKLSGVPESAEKGTMYKTLSKLRELEITRLLVPNGYREHIDHAAVNGAGTYDGPQVGDPVLVDWGRSEPIRSYLEYAVWGDFSPEGALVAGRDESLRANRILSAKESVERKIRAGIGQFESQRDIIKGLVEAREARRLKGEEGAADRYVELYRKFDPRPSLDYGPYIRYLKRLKGRD